MIKITNGVDVFEVTSGAYEIFKNQGYCKIVEEKPVKNVEPQKTAEEILCEELSEKPLSQWTQEELKTFVAVKKINISSATKVSEVRAAVKKYMDNL